MKKFFLPFLISLCIVSEIFFIPTAFAIDKNIGEVCSNLDCGTGDCEEGTNDEKRCVCQEAADCTAYGNQDGEQWECKDGTPQTNDWHYCQSSIRGDFIPGRDETPINAPGDFLQRTGFTQNEIDTLSKAPKVQIQIPGLALSDTQIVEEAEGRFLLIPFLGEYIAQVYQYAILIASILAVLVIILSGLSWAISGGGDTKDKDGKNVLSAGITGAKKRIGGAIIGIVLAVGSYTILNFVNPELVVLDNLKIPIVDTVSLDSLVFDKTGEDFTGNVNVSNTDLDNLFQAYASCYGYDWRVLKAFAAAESGLDPNARRPGSKYHGLFQMSKEYCEGGMKLGEFPSSLNFNCSNRIEAETNTAAAAATVERNLQRIQSACPGITAHDATTLLYVGHNNGPAVMGHALQERACKQPDIRNAVGDFYQSRGGNNKGITVEYGLRKHDYARGKVVSAVNQLGVKQSDPLYPSGAKNNTTCPAQTGKRVLQNSVNTTPIKNTLPPVGDISCPNSTGKKILAVGDSNTEYASSYANVLASSCNNIEISKSGHSGKSASFVYNQISNRNLRQEGFTDIIVWAGVNNINDAQRGLGRIYEKAHAEGLRVIAITITPWKEYGNWSAANNQTTLQVNNWIRGRAGGKLNANDVIIDVYDFFEDPNREDYLNPALGRDKIHLNPEGQKRLAKQINDAAL